MNLKFDAGSNTLVEFEYFKLHVILKLATMKESYV